MDYIRPSFTSQTADLPERAIPALNSEARTVEERPRRESSLSCEADGGFEHGEADA